MNDLNNRIEQYLKFPALTAELTLSEEQIKSLLVISEELKTELALQSIKLDPYWPKWDSPWWKVLLLYETGYKHLIPIEFLDVLIDVIDKHYLHDFPLTEAELPKGIDPYRDILCFCALGNMYKVFEDCGFCIKERLPWWYEWLSKYQLPDGGYNCEEAAYTKSRKSSFLSTLPVLEAMLIVYCKTHDDKIKTLLDKGAHYLLSHNMYKSSTGKIIEADWLQISFPRYYDYDVLRGFSFIVDWAYQTQSALPVRIAEDCFNQIQKSIDPAGYIILKANKVNLDGSLYHINHEWIWKDKAESFTALDMLCKENSLSVPLTLNWRKTLDKLSSLSLN